MKVRRIIANIAAADLAAAKRFYGDVLGLDLLMDHGWIATWGSTEQMPVQISFAVEGGSGTPVPDLSIEVDDVEAALAGMKAAGFAIEYGPADEPWGVRRFYVRDPFGRLVNILSHL
ncbi:catechol 2,3-dioxygenase-like lactoylglutathione lyase family enzyme [Aquamicrobium lusatiense]|uniref:Catechol 2,3-dioxygenase-like lactoylglutathione lyase family enzyme n=1 Tax=Aquamicrobium lusatiense TaxID=89772 RepID=A0A7W9S1D1_9HYPH|nr:VOC family protein [Aquamicrobium lusatiense]MBB6011113.1 catechol 2,3-dioxygenase-like lactoylglutathione lyase family enzyme [Aquamicrobium lusatiense]